MFALPGRRPQLTRVISRASVAVIASTTMLAGGFAATAPAAAATPGTTRMALGRTAHFQNFDVTAIKTLMDPDYFGYVIKLKVCVTRLPAGSTGGKTRVSWDPWTVQTSRHVRRPSVQEDPPPDTFPLPYQSEGRFAVGQCATGWLPFWSVKATDKIISINYDNSLGDHARWAPAKPLTVGTAKTLKHTTVLVSKVRRDQFWYGVKVKTCVDNLPAGHQTIRFGWHQWSLWTDRGTILMQIAQEGVSPWSPVYPQAKRLKQGQCIAAWLPFAVPADVQVSKIDFTSFSGDEVTWTAP